LTSFDPGTQFSVSGGFSSDGGHLAAWDSGRGLSGAGILRSVDVSRAPFACDLGVLCSPVVAPDGQLLIPGPDLVSFLDP
jgi:hypothetical protein